ncbi:hypothetical protein K438DRAFT_1971565 [Mycena galopus ATCC 62051]|nr:hypothetical protein K438DRAFT_1971565 [Mycena galopus ATCC 62051]
MSTSIAVPTFVHSVTHDTPNLWRPTPRRRHLQSGDEKISRSVGRRLYIRLHHRSSNSAVPPLRTRSVVPLVTALHPSVVLFLRHSMIHLCGPPLPPGPHVPNPALPGNEVCPQPRCRARPSSIPIVHHLRKRHLPRTSQSQSQSARLWPSILVFPVPVLMQVSHQNLSSSTTSALEPPVTGVGVGSRPLALQPAPMSLAARLHLEVSLPSPLPLRNAGALEIA